MPRVALSTNKDLAPNASSAEAEQSAGVSRPPGYAVTNPAWGSGGTTGTELLVGRVNALRDGKQTGEREDDKDTQPLREHLQSCQSAWTSPCPSVCSHAPFHPNLPPTGLEGPKLPLPGR